jgi:protein-L-isoaspartate O-methyltransferase
MTLVSVPRAAFLPPDLAELAYEDSPLPIAEGLTIWQVPRHHPFATYGRP